MEGAEGRKDGTADPDAEPPFCRCHGGDGLDLEKLRRNEKREEEHDGEGLKKRRTGGAGRRQRRGGSGRIGSGNEEHCRGTGKARRRGRGRKVEMEKRNEKG